MTRARVLGVALTLSVLASLWAVFSPQPDDLLSERTARVSAPSRAAAADERIAYAAPKAIEPASNAGPPLQLPDREAPKGTRRNPFTAYSWEPPRTAAAAPVVAVAKPPLTLPYTFAGRLITTNGPS